MDLRSVNSPEGPRPIGPYSHAILAADLVFCSGMVAVDPATNTLIEGDMAAQTRRALDNLAAALAAAGSDLAHVVKTTVFLVELADFKAMNEAYAERFGGHKPARSTIGVAGLPLGARLEIECIAVRK